MAETRTVTLDELKAHTKKDDFYVLLNGKGTCPPCAGVSEPIRTRRFPTSLRWQ